MKILLTSTSFQDTPGKHQTLLAEQNFEVDYLRGPLREEVLLPIIENYDGIICGDDEITEQVIIKGKNGKLKAISKYGIGLDKIDLIAAKKYNIPVANTPGVNHITVAEHILALLFAFYKNIHLEYNITKNGRWERFIGHELFGKKIAILGLGRIGKEVAQRANALGLKVKAHDVIKNENYIIQNNIEWFDKVTEMLVDVDILSINCPLTQETRGLINKDSLINCKSDLVIINTARADVIKLEDIIEFLESGKIGGYLTDVLEEEPMKANHSLLKFPNVIITPHIGSRTFESVERQGTAAVENIIKQLQN